jgi:drug/metabolite transporter (DMT)-like permease
MSFTLAVLSAIFAGVYMFAQKVAVERGMDSYLLTAFSAGASFVFGAIIMSATSSWGDIPTSVYGYAVFGGVLFIIFSVLRMEALKHIDATIFFPLYKVIGPAVTALIGIFVLSETITTTEGIGIVLSCIVPLLLITRAENSRQKNLTLGLILLAIGAFLASVSAAVNAYAIGDVMSYALPLLVVTHLFSFFFGVALFLRKHKPSEMVQALRTLSKPFFIFFSIGMGIVQFLAFYALLLAFSDGGLSLAYAINAHYFIIPVILSIWFYGEHWNVQKILALILSLSAVALLYH